MIAVDWRPVRLVIFDVDGTLYDHRAVQRRLVLPLLARCLFQPHGLRTLRILLCYRRVRRQLAVTGAPEAGTRQFTETARRLGLDPETTERTVQSWILDRPLSYLLAYRYEGVERLIDKLRESGRSIGIFSDYPAGDKLSALGLSANVTVAATDPEVGRLKPHPAGLLRLLELARVTPEQALFIGDRDDRDGECARRAGISYLLKNGRSGSRDHQFGHYCEVLATLGATVAEGACYE